MARASDTTYSQVLDALATLTCDGDKVFAQSGCVYQGTLCSDAGTCSSDGVCSCNSGREGQYCEKASSDGLSDGAIAGIVVGVVIPLLLLLLLIIIAIVFVVRLLRRKKVAYASTHHIRLMKLTGHATTERRMGYRPERA